MATRFFERTVEHLRAAGVSLGESRQGPFGSWLISLAVAPALRIVYDGRDGALYVEAEVPNPITRSSWTHVWTAASQDACDPARVVREVQSLLQRDLCAEAATWSKQIGAFIKDD